ncbi:MAG TPA: hypothetical protein VFQ61_11145 [Polyangiaceae bacterium]|nr:hypothetical protein [Polyangiaceae bacterium]
MSIEWLALIASPVKVSRRVDVTGTKTNVTHTVNVTEDQQP